LKVAVNHPEPGNIIDDRKEPTGPVQLIRVVTLEKLPVEKRNKKPHCIFRSFSVDGTPATDGSGFSADFPLHFENRGIRQANLTSAALISQKVKGFSGGVYMFFLVIRLKPVFLKERIERGYMTVKARSVLSEQYYIIGISGIYHILIVKMTIHLLEIDVRQKRRGRSPRHNAVFVFHNLFAVTDQRIRKHPHEKRI